MSKIIYLDNASTSFPKPESVYQAHDEYARRAANPGRGVHKMALDSARTIFEARNSIAELLGVSHPERLIFTPGCTYSINTALRGFPFKQGDVVVVTALEHNAVTRTMLQLSKERGIKMVAAPYGSKGVIDLHALIKILLDEKPRLCVFSEASNVTGECIDLKSIAAICGAHKIPIMLDAAQTAGRMTTPIDQSGVAIWCASGHKGLFGVPGVGLLYTNPNVELEPLITGGTGSRSDSYQMPDAYPDHLEAGTLPGPAIAALGAGARWIKDTTVSAIVEKEMALTQRFLDWTAAQERIRVIGNRASQCTSTVSFLVPDVSSDRVASFLDGEYGIAVRTGLQCSAAAHETFGTTEEGLVRVSFGYFNTNADVDVLCQALEKLPARADQVEAPL